MKLAQSNLHLHDCFFAQVSNCLIDFLTNQLTTCLIKKARTQSGNIKQAHESNICKFMKRSLKVKHGKNKAHVPSIARQDNMMKFLS